MIRHTAPKPHSGRRERGGAGEHSGVAMKAGWVTKKLGDVCQFINGLWKGEKPPFINIGVFRNTNFTKDGTLDYSDIAYLDVELKKFETRRLVYGDLILEKSGGGPKQPVGRVALFDKKDGAFSFSNFTAAMRVNDPNTLDFRFLHRFLFWTHLVGVTETMQSHSTGIRNLAVKAYKNIEISLPPIPEQRRIVRILDKAFDDIATAKANAEKNLQNARALFESHLQAVFSQQGEGWEEKPLESVTEILNGYAFKSTDFSSTKGVKCIKITNVGVKEFVHDSDTCLPADFAEKYAAVSVRAGNIVLALTRTIIAGGLKVAVVPDEYDGALLNQRVASILPDPEQTTASFLFAYLSTQEVVNYVTERVNVLMQPNLSIKDLRSMPIPLPTLYQQDRITDQLSNLREETKRLESIYQQKLTALDELKKSLLHQAFNGEL
jgi:type I restriction enzyme, S subunit